LVNSVERRETLEENSPNLQRRWSLEQPGDQTWQGRILFGLFSMFRVLERQSYQLSLLAMLVKKTLNEYKFPSKSIQFRHGV
jgi:hypothetical protein